MEFNGSRRGGRRRNDTEKQQPTDSVSIGKFDILATYTYAHALLSGADDDEAK